MPKPPSLHTTSLSTQMHSTSHPQRQRKNKAREEIQVELKTSLEDNPEDLASHGNFHDNTTLATLNEPVSSKARNSISKKAEEEQGERRNPAHAKCDVEDFPEDPARRANGRTWQEKKDPVHAKSDLEDNLEILASGANIDMKSTGTSQNNWNATHSK